MGQVRLDADVDDLVREEMHDRESLTQAANRLLRELLVQAPEAAPAPPPAPRTASLSRAVRRTPVGRTRRLG